MYQHAGVALLRAARVPMAAAPSRWPDLTDGTDVDDAVTWLGEVWANESTAEAIALASPSLASQVARLLAGASLTAKQIRQVVDATVRYVLREAGRPTPFGLFAGVAWVGFGPTTKRRWGDDHGVVARPDGQWLAEVIAELEHCPQLLGRLPVVLNNLCAVRGRRLVLPAQDQVSIRYTAVVQAVRRAACRPVGFAALAEALARQFPTASMARINGVLTELVTRGFLVTSLRPPATVTDPLGYLLEQLHQVDADTVSPVTATVRNLRLIRAGLEAYGSAEPDARQAARASVVRQMRTVSTAGRSPLAVDLQLDCDLTLPDAVAQEAQAAASALLRLGGQPRGPRVWRDYYAAFVARYGTGTLVALTDLIDPDTGLGYPAGYPGSLLDLPPEPARSARDDQLLALIHQAALDGREEIVLDDELIADLEAEGFDPARIPPHVELCVRVRAKSLAALDQGKFTLTVWPARAVGTLTGRFHPSTDTADLLQALPTGDADAIAAQLSFPPLYPHAENIGRVSQFLPDIISIGEHRHPEETGTVPIEDLAVTADRQRLRLVSISRGRPVEPQVFHALRLDKQPPTLARFLTHLPRSHLAAYTEFDWGAAAGLPHLPLVRYRRSVLSPARWQLHAGELPGRQAGWKPWQQALTRWRHRWQMPQVVELRDADRALRLDLSQTAHARLLRKELNRTGHAELTEAADPTAYGWIGGHAHQIAVPLVSTRPGPPNASPMTGLVRVGNDGGGQLPATPGSRWLFAKVYVHPDRHDEVLTDHLPQLLATVGEQRAWWFLRYRSAHEPDHLRLRIAVTDSGDYGTCAAAVGAWTARLRDLGLVRRLVLDTYLPEVGRYGTGPALAAAEAVFAADSRAVIGQLQVPATAVYPTALVVANLVDIACGFTGGTEPGMGWLTRHARHDQPAPASRPVADQAVELADPDHAVPTIRELPGGTTLLTRWQVRRAALARYRQQLPPTADRDAVLSSLLHMHHIRAVGIDRDHERVCLRLARAAALRWQARNESR